MAVAAVVVVAVAVAVVDFFGSVGYYHWHWHWQLLLCRSCHIPPLRRGQSRSPPQPPVLQLRSHVRCLWAHGFLPSRGPEPMAADNVDAKMNSLVTKTGNEAARAFDETSHAVRENLGKLGEGIAELNKVLKQLDDYSKSQITEEVVKEIFYIQDLVAEVKS